MKKARGNKQLHKKQTSPKSNSKAASQTSRANNPSPKSQNEDQLIREVFGNIDANLNLRQDEPPSDPDAAESEHEVVEKGTDETKGQNLAEMRQSYNASENVPGTADDKFFGQTE